MKSGIYKITNLKNNKIYIGRAVDLQNRKWQGNSFAEQKESGGVSFLRAE